MGQSRRRQLAELVIDQWEQLRGGFGIAGFNLRQDSGDVAHGTGPLSVIKVGAEKSADSEQPS